MSVGLDEVSWVETHLRDLLAAQPPPPSVCGVVDLVYGVYGGVDESSPFGTGGDSR